MGGSRARRGDQVAATSRSESAFDDLVEKYGDAVLPLRADVADRAAAFEAVECAIDTFGALNVVIEGEPGRVVEAEPVQ
ncbi:hypothetical protein [Streptomyces sp. NPDC126522]|uniref:hypothetical protein n=1 Tax=Streptomyces sp. NPDC126522 TaxID=3155211 RepID=UPI0033211677